MPVFNGTIRLEEGDGLDTTMTIDSGRLVVAAGEHEIGNWAVDELSAEQRDDGFCISVEGDEILVAVADTAAFSEALGIKDRKGRSWRERKPKAAKLKRKERSVGDANPPPATAAAVLPAPQAETQAVAAASDEEPPLSLWQRIPVRGKLIGAGVLALMVFGLLAPNALALVLILAGMATLLLAIAAKSESGTGILPPPFFATTGAVVGGIASVLLAMAIMVIT